MPVDKLVRQDKAAICLKIVVIGGSVAGLATAYALKRAGHDVRVIEKSDGKSKSIGGVQSPPNMTKILYRWGLQPLLDRVAHKCKSMIFLKGRTGETVGTINFDEGFVQDLLADFLLIQDQELKDLLYQLASDEGVNVSFSTSATRVHTAPDTATVTLNDGEIVSADFLVFADGYDSIFRSLVTGIEDEDNKIPLKKHLAITFILPVDLLPQDEDKRLVGKVGNWMIWIGSGFVLHSYFINEGKDLSTTLTCNYDREILPEDEVWTDHPMEHYDLDFDKFEPRARNLLRLAKNATGRVFVSREAPEELVGENSKIVLVGDAAHPLLPGGNHHTALIFEDAETLRCLFSRIRDPAQVSHFLAAYEEIRQPRAAWSLEYDNGFHAMMKLPDGPEQDERNAALAQSMVHGDWDHMDETLFRAVWGNELTIYVHDATEQVDDWWTQWGSMIMKKKDEKPQHQASPTPEASLPSLIPGLHRVSFHHP